MRAKLHYAFLLIILLCAKTLFGQREGFFVAPTVLTGYSSISGVYHANPEYAPANKGFNLAFQYGLTAGYKLEKWGIATSFKFSHYQQNFNQNNLSGYLNTRYLSYGGSLFYQFERLQSSRHYHTAYLGYTLNVPQSAAYYINDNVDATVYSNLDAFYQLQNDNMITAGYGITTGYKLLWAEFNVMLGYSLGNIYKPLTGASGKNFFIGFGLSFGLFVNTTK